MKQKCLSLLFILLASNILRAQDTLVEWNPSGVGFNLHLQPYYLEFNQANPINFGIGLRMDYYASSHFSFHASAKQALFDQNNYNANSKGFKDSENKTGLFRQMEAGTAVYFAKDGYTSARVYAWPGAYYYDPIEKDTIYYYSKEDLPCRSLVGLRLGYYGWSQSISNTLKKGLLSTNNVLLPDTLDLYTTQNVNGMYAGISISKLVDLVYHSDDGVSRKVSFVRNMYIDVIYCPSITFSNIILNGVSYDVSGPGGFRKQDIGGRLVFEKIGSRDLPRLNFSYRFEAGIRPGLADKGFFMMFTLGAGISK